MSSPWSNCGLPPEVACLWVSYAEFGSAVGWLIYAIFSTIKYLETGEGLWVYTLVAVPLRIVAHAVLGFVLFKGVTKRFQGYLKIWLWTRGILLIFVVVFMIVSLAAFSAPQDVHWPVVGFDVIYWLLILWAICVVRSFLGQLQVKAVPKLNAGVAVAVIDGIPTGISNPAFEEVNVSSVGHI